MSLLLSFICREKFKRSASLFTQLQLIVFFFPTLGMIFIRDEPRRSVYFELQINGGTIFCAINDRMQEKEIKEQKALEESQV